MIKQESIDKVLQATDIVEIIQRFADLKKSGVGFQGCCPFHEEKTPSFHVNPRKQIFKCFGCGEGGNALSFVMKYKKATFPEAIKYLAESYNITLEHDTAQITIEQQDVQDRAAKVLAATERLYRNTLKSNDIAQQYLLNKRKFTLVEIEEWGIGFGGTDWQLLTGNVVKDPLLEGMANELGLIKTKDAASRSYDALRCRITIPIHDHNGKLKGFAGRDILKEVEPDSALELPKYVNPSESFYYHKSQILFGLDKARKAITTSGYAILVEGYFDVTSMHRIGLDMTVGTCGTALTIQQVKLLKRYTASAIIMFDGDKAGIAAIEKSLNPLLAEGFKVLYANIPDGKDPDDWANSLQPDNYPNADEFAKQKQDALYYWATYEFNKDNSAQGKELFAKKLADKIALIPSEIVATEYTTEFAKLFKIKSKTLKEYIDGSKAVLIAEKNREQAKEKRLQGVPDEYTLPDGVEWEKVKDDVYNYGIFIHNNQIWAGRGKDDFKHFKEVSNFSIRIIQHMEDDKRAMKLCEIQNMHGRKRIFDTPSTDFNSLNDFNRAVTNFGNFKFTGTAEDFQKLTCKLFDEMGDGRMINILGWQNEGFWAMSNSVIFSNGNFIYVDKYGCFKHENQSYYTPAGNSIYENNPSKHVAQKRARYVPSKFSLQEYCSQIRKVHRGHAMNAVLFSISTMFSDIVFDRIGSFPVLFLYGEASTGKDNLIECIQSFFGKPQQPLSLMGKANTDKGKIRKFAQFANFPVHGREYKNGTEDVDLMLMGLWERQGYERGTIESSVGTESVSVISTLVFTGNDYPIYDPLITRIITEELTKTEFSEADKQEFEKLKEMNHEGASGFLTEIMKLRPDFENNFRKYYKQANTDLKKQLNSLGMAERMIQNASVFLSTYRICQHKLSLGFTEVEWMDHCMKALTKQNNKRSSGSIMAKWWDCIVAAVKDEKSLIHGRDFIINGNEFAINFSAAYEAYVNKYYQLYKEKGKSKSELMEKLKREDSFESIKDTVRFGQRRTSAYCFFLDKTGIQEEILLALDYLGRKGNYNKPTEETEPVRNNENSATIVPVEELPF